MSVSHRPPGHRRRLGLLLAVMAVITLSVAAVSIGELYRVAVEVRRQALADTVSNRAALLEEIAERSSTAENLLPLVWDAKVVAPGIGRTGEFMVGRRVGDRIEFLVMPRGGPPAAPAPVAVGGPLAEPMQRALAGGTGTMVGRDYRGRRVLAAYEPIHGPGFGLVAKIDLAEVRATFYKIGGFAGSAALVLVALGSLLFLRLSDPIARGIEASEERYRTLFDQVPVGLYRTTPEGAYVEANHRMAQILGFEHRDDLLAIPVSDVYADQEVRARWQVELAAEGRLEGVEIQVRTPSGELRWVRHSAHAITGQDGRVVAYEGAAEDITEQRRIREALAESERRFRAAFEQAAVGMAQVATDGTFLRLNRRLCEIVGYSQDELLGITFQGIAHPADLEADLAQVQRLLTGEISTYSMEERYIRKDGATVWVHLTVSLVRDALGAPEYFIDIVEDIGERKRAEAAIRALNAELEERVAARTTSLEAANKELESFSYTVSHDLRAPLRSIDGFSRILLEEHAAVLPEEGRRYLGIVRDSTVRMGQLIDELLAFSRLGRRELRRERVDLAPLLGEVIEELAGELEDRRVDWRLGRLCPCHGDPRLLKVVLANLLANAVKFTRHREPAVIEVSCRNDDGTPTYFVRDNGAGFDMRYADKLFGVFQRLHREDEFPGTGVGLATCRRIISRHGGRIWAEAEPDVGATFSFTVEDGRS